MLATSPPIETFTYSQLTATLAGHILQALHLLTEHKRTSFTHKGRRALLYEAAMRQFQAAYAAVRILKESLPEKPKSDTEKQAADMVAALRKYQGAYYAHKEAPTAENLEKLETSTKNLRRTALRIKNEI